MNLRAIFMVCICLMVFFFTGCKKVNVNTSPTEGLSENNLYDNGLALMKKNAEKGRLILKEVIQLYPTSIFAQKAKIAIADSFFNQKDSSALIIAVSEYQEYLGLYPNSPDAVYAKYQIGMSYFRQMKKPGRDQSNSIAAIKAFESLVRQFPDTQEAETARKQINKAKQNVAQHFFLIGKTNFFLHAFQGALNRFKEVLDSYPDFVSMDHLIFLTAQSHLGLGDRETACSFFQQIVTRFPKSKFAKKSAGMLKKLNFKKADN